MAVGVAHTIAGPSGARAIRAPPPAAPIPLRSPALNSASVLTTPRLTLTAFTDADIPALAAILAEPEVTKSITADGSTPERCLASARARIAWHQGSWPELGYGVWAVRARGIEGVAPGTLVGWCGFAEPDVGADPEILYGLAPAVWRRGLASEAAGAAVDWLFTATPHAGVSAVIFARLAPGSLALVRKLGLTRRSTMAMADFMPDPVLAQAVLDYELWRLAHGRSADEALLLFEAPYKGGQFASLGLGETAAIEQAFCDAAARRGAGARLPPAERDRRVRDAFRLGGAEPWLDWYHRARPEASAED
jgi:ribosomal-protein-alanine N-acetyltransferase